MAKYSPADIAALEAALQKVRQAEQAGVGVEAARENLRQMQARLEQASLTLAQAEQDADTAVGAIGRPQPQAGAAVPPNLPPFPPSGGAGGGARNPAGRNRVLGIPLWILWVFGGILTIFFIWLLVNSTQIGKVDKKADSAIATAKDAVAIGNVNSAAIKKNAETIDRVGVIANDGLAKANEAMAKADEVAADLKKAKDCGCGKAVKPHHRKPAGAKPVVVAPRPPAPVAAPAPTPVPVPAPALAPKAEADCKPNCVPVPEAKLLSKRTARVCGIEIQKSSSDKTIIGNLQLDEDPKYPGKIRLAKVNAFEGSASKVEVTPFPFSGDKDCNADKAQIYRNWPVVVKKMDLDADCIPVMSRKS